MSLAPTLVPGCRLPNTVRSHKWKHSLTFKQCLPDAPDLYTCNCLLCFCASERETMVTRNSLLNASQRASSVHSLPRQTQFLSLLLNSDMSLMLGTCSWQCQRRVASLDLSDTCRCLAVSVGLSRASSRSHDSIQLSLFPSFIPSVSHVCQNLHQSVLATSWCSLVITNNITRQIKDHGRSRRFLSWLQLNAHVWAACVGVG